MVRMREGNDFIILMRYQRVTDKAAEQLANARKAPQWIENSSNK